MSWTLLLAEALAGPPGLLADEGVSVVVRGVAEAWDDGAVTHTYRPTGMMAGVGLVVPLHSALVVDFEFARRRLDGEDMKLVLSPVSLVVEGRLPTRTGYAFAGAGVAIAVFAEQASTSTNGSIGSLEARGGLRWDLDMDLGQARGTFIELYGGRRMQRHTLGEGYDLAAWRGAVGVGLTF